MNADVASALMSTEQKEVLSQNTNLSNSAIFSQMRHYYTQKGIEAWETGEVPSFITSNRVMGQTYADLIFAYLLDYIQTNPGYNFKDNPFYIVEICAGHGKLGFYIIKSLIELLKKHKLNSEQFQYILTDISQKNLDSWSKHSALQPYIKSGQLDFGLFDVESQSEITLINSKKTLKAGSIDTPIFVIGNYAFDTLSHDAFQIKNNKLFETQVSVLGDKSVSAFDNMQYEFIENEVKDSYYDIPELNTLLKEYTDYFETASVLIPIGGLKGIEVLKSFSTQELVLLVADKGYHDKLCFPAATNPHLAQHGSVSLMVNFDAIRRYFELQSGFGVMADETVGTFHVGLFSTGQLSNKTMVAHACEKVISRYNPSDFFHLQKLKSEKALTESIERVVAMIRLSEYESHIFFHVSDALLELSTKLNYPQKRSLEKVILKVWDNYFLLEKHQDVALAAAKILVNLESYQHAEKLFRFSLTNFFPNAEIYYGLAICYFQLKELSRAKKMIRRSLNLDPNNPSVQALKKIIDTA